MIATLHWLFDSSPLPRRWSGDGVTPAVLTNWVACTGLVLALLVVLVRKLPRALWRRRPEAMEASIEVRTAALEAARSAAITAHDAAASALRARERHFSSFRTEARAPIEVIVRHADHILPRSRAVRGCAGMRWRSCSTVAISSSYSTTSTSME